MAVINGTSGHDTLTDTSANDTINGFAGNDTINGGSGGTDVVDGGDGRDSLQFMSAISPVLVEFEEGVVAGGRPTSDVTFFSNIERVVTGDFNDELNGNGAAQNLTARGGMDTLWGAGGFDTLWGGSGADTFIFREFGSANADNIGDWTSGSDKLQLDAAVFTALGSSGSFTAGDARFAANSSGTAQDASDRIIFETDTRQVWYDADGNGAGARQLIANLQVGATLVATDIVVEGGSGGGGQVINGTSGNDSLVGTDGDDTMNGLAGDDTLAGGIGNDLMNGGTGNDSLRASEDDNDTLIGGDGDDTLNGETHTFGEGDPGVDTLDGGLGNDFFVVDNPADALSDAGGIDTVRAVNTSWTLGAGFEHLIIANGETETVGLGIGNELDNRIEGDFTVQLEGRAGNDTLLGGGWEDTLLGGDGNDSMVSFDLPDILSGGGGDDTLDGSIDIDTLTGGAGADVFFFTDASGDHDHVTDFASGSDKLRFDGASFTQIGGSGTLANDARYAMNGTGTAQDANDRVIYNTVSGELWYDPDGTGATEASRVAILQGAPELAGADIEIVNGTGPSDGNDHIVGTAGDDSLSGLGGNDTLEGLEGNDTLDGGTGDERLFGGPGNDSLTAESGWFFGEDGDDTMIGAWNFFVGQFSGTSPGNDVIVGTSESDSLRYDLFGSPQSGVSINLANGTGSGGGVGGAGSVQLTGIEHVQGTDFADVLTGDDGFNGLGGGAGDDTLDGGFGNDNLEGGAGADHYVLSTAPGAGNVDFLETVESGVDKIVLDATVMSALGASGNFAPNDPRFHAAQGATSGHDADDRVIFNLSDGRLYYDADGNGSGAAQLIATTHDPQGFEVEPIAATDIVVINGSAPGNVINGTSGHDTLTDTTGNDTINGLAGNDTINGGHGGTDVVNGGDGRDSLMFMTATSAVVFDFVAGTMTGGGTGTTSFTSIERAVSGDFNDRLTGNAAAQNLTARSGADTLAGAGGIDTLWGGAGADTFIFRENGSANADVIGDWASGSDEIALDNAVMAALGADGAFVAGDARFKANATGTATDTSDRVIFNTTTGQLFYDADGNGSGAALLIADVQAGASIAATDISVI